LLRPHQLTALSSSRRHSAVVPLTLQGAAPASGHRLGLQNRGIALQPGQVLRHGWRTILSRKDIKHPSTTLRCALPQSLVPINPYTYRARFFVSSSPQALVLCLGLKPQQCLMLSLVPIASSAATAIPLRADLRSAPEIANTTRFGRTSSRTRQPQPTTGASRGHPTVLDPALYSSKAIRQSLEAAKYH
jgi:hypothetical protein